MWKVLIADDEPKIRRGIRNLIDWNELGMEVVGEAEDGEIALEIAESALPDLMIVDICMPFIDGLQLIERVAKILPNSLVIVVSGHDEFSYAQQAIKLKAFDYLLKPVVKDKLYSVLQKAKEQLEHESKRQKYMQWANQQLNRNFPFLKERFLNDLIGNHLSPIEIEEQMDFLGIQFPANPSLLLVKIIEKFRPSEIVKEWDRQLLLFAVSNILQELILPQSSKLLFRDDRDNILAIIPKEDCSDWHSLSRLISETIEKHIKASVKVIYKHFPNGVGNVGHAYEELITELAEDGGDTPAVLFAKNYIEDNYYKIDLSLQDLADEIQISPAYLSRLLRQELGVSFIDYLTQIRMKHALKLLNDPVLKIYEVAERVGYSSQHYFCTVFKKMLNVTPIEYKKGAKK